MRFGPWIKLILILSIATSACKDDRKSYIGFASPTQGQNVKLGEAFDVALELKDPDDITKIDYFIDNHLVASLNQYQPIQLQTKGYGLGFKTIRAIVMRAEMADTITSNIVIYANVAPKPLQFDVVATFPHDTAAYTEGLSFVGDQLLESTGEKGKSQLRLVNFRTGEVKKRATLDAQYFGEGSVKVDNQIIWLTWEENKGFVFDANTLQQTGSFPYEQSREGWGLTFDGHQILRSDGSNRIWRMNAKTFKEEGFIEVYDDKGPVDQLNELEFINGKVFANVYTTHRIVVINPENGVVENDIDLSSIVPQNYFKTEREQLNNVLNGIAYHKQRNMLLVTGKKWPKLYQIRLHN